MAVVFPVFFIGSVSTESIFSTIQSKMEILFKKIKSATRFCPLQGKSRKSRNSIDTFFGNCAVGKYPVAYLPTTFC